MNAYMPTSQTDDWATPQNLFDELDAIHNFTLDVAASSTNHKTQHWFGLDHENPLLRDGLAMSWQNNRVWCNPPYGRKCFDWIKKLADHNNGIALVFARTETIGFHEQVWQRADAIFFFKGRLKFYYVDGTQGGSANAPSCLISYGKENTKALIDFAENNEGALIIL